MFDSCDDRSRMFGGILVNRPNGPVEFYGSICCSLVSDGSDSIVVFVPSQTNWRAASLSLPATFQEKGENGGEGGGAN